MLRTKGLAAAALAATAVFGLGGCVTEHPTIAHVHIGHAVTGASDTPDGEGYFLIAERRAQAAKEATAGRFEGADGVEARKAALRDLNEIINATEGFPLSKAVEAAASHIEYAADSADATQNVRASAAGFKRNTEGVLYRSSLVDMYTKDALAARTPEEIEPLASEIRLLVVAIIDGEDLDGNGVIGDSPREYGVRQLRQALDEMVAREDPPYATVDRWYLLNLIRMPSGEWLFRRSGSRSGPNY